MVQVPQFLRDNYEIREWRHAIAILAQDYIEEWNDIIEVLSGFQLKEEDVVVGGGQKSKIAGALDGAFTKRGWKREEIRDVR